MYIILWEYGGARWLSDRVSDSGARGWGFETYRRRVVSLSKTLYSPKVPRKRWLSPDMTEKLLTGTLSLNTNTKNFGSMNQYDLTFDLKINVGHCDVYFMVQWFGLISWRLFDVWTSLFGIMGPYDPAFDLKINVGLCDLYFMVIMSYISNTIWCMNFSWSSDFA